MSSDEEATIIGRMVLERNELTKQRALLDEELSRLGTRLSVLGTRLKDIRSPHVNQPFQLTDTERAALDAPKITRLLTEAEEVSKRFHDLMQNLTKVGV